MAIVLSRHAETVMAARDIATDWVTQALTTPDVSLSDPADPTLMRSYRRIEAANGRILRVVHRQHEGDILVVTAFFDRGAKL